MYNKYIKSVVFFAIIGLSVFIFPPKIATFLNNQGFKAFNERDFNKAIDLYNKALFIYPGSEIYFNLGCAYEIKNEDDKALDYFKKAIEHDQSYKKAYNAVVSIYTSKAEYDQAEEYLNKLASLGKNTTEDEDHIKDSKAAKVYNHAVRLYKLNKLEEALNKFHQVINLSPENYLAYKAVADIYYKQNKLFEALKFYKRAVALGLKDADAYNSMGIIFMRFEDYGSALVYLKKAYKMQPENLNYMYSVASVLRDIGKMNQALSMYKKLVAKASRYPNVHNDMAGIYSFQGFQDKAKREYEKERKIVSKIIKRGDNDDFTLVRLAAALNGLNRFQEAEDILDKVIKNNPNCIEAYYERGSLYRKTKRQSKANSDYKKARKLGRGILIADYYKREKNIKKTRTVKVSEENQFIENAKIYLNNGHVVKGRIKSQNENTIVLQIKTGQSISEVTFHKSKIKLIKNI